MAEALTAPLVAADLTEGPATRLRSLFDGHYDFVWRSLRRLGVADEAVDDAAQEVFLVAARKIAKIQGGNERSFLFGTALRIASDARRQQKKGAARSAGESALERIQDPRPNPEEQLEQTRARALLDQVLAELPMDLRVVFVLFELEGMSMAEMAVCLELPQGTVASRIRRARQHFQASVKRLQAATRGQS